MITAQVIENCIEELGALTKVNLAVYDLDGTEMASTFEESDVSGELIRGFADSPAGSQTIGKDHLLKIMDDGELAYILAARGNSDHAHIIGKIAVSQIQQLIMAYKERLDRNHFFQNLLMDNLLLVDVYNRAKKLHIEVTVPRVVYIVETRTEKDNAAAELLRGMFSVQSGDFVTAVDENNVILIKALNSRDGNAHLEQTAQTIVDMMSTEAMMNARVAYGTVVQELKDVSKSYKEAMMALEVGKIFYVEKKVNSYGSLGIGRLIYQLPANLCKIFIDEIFGENDPGTFDEEIISTINKFFDNNLNVSETSRQLFVHRNTLVYRVEKLQKSTGLDVRTFDDALTFKIAMMVYNYMKYLETENR
ncbi:MAG: helix-turn-helix domain-containing protein [Lachnospiraceae bacterium]|nr:helix-turn-helix domain-containing protein [Lachnospiraceae bacterium]MDE6186130.1 helix-turn-helix domain-containing protein [Lachnospiraceae bacterium]MDE7287101.1 helix-turn-helix domain-containing protein [Lachnospiraceae bacterium]